VNLEQPAAVTPAAVTPRSCSIEVAVPLPVSHKWVAYACRTAGVGKPKWNAIREVWTTTAKGEAGRSETIAITGSGDRTVKVKVEWQSANDAERDTPTLRRIVTAMLTQMQWAVRTRRASDHYRC
jgi:hypothetical protein